MVLRFNGKIHVESRGVGLGRPGTLLWAFADSGAKRDPQHMAHRIDSSVLAFCMWSLPEAADLSKGRAS